MFESILIDLAKKLLREKTVDLIIGYGSTHYPFRTEPIVINQEEQMCIRDRGLWYFGWSERYS